MSDHLSNLRNFMEIAGTTFTVSDVQEPQVIDTSYIEVASDHDSLLESLELLRFKLVNHRQMIGSAEYALGYEEACMKIVEMIDGIVRNQDGKF